MIKLIAIDLDGTLLTDDKKLPPDFWTISQSLLQKGVVIVIASGRPYHNVSAIFERMQQQLYFACDNGAFVIHNEDELLVNKLDMKAIKKIITLSRSLNDVYPVLCGKHVAYIENVDESFREKALQYYQKYEIVNDATQVNDVILKISLCDLNGSEINSYPVFKKLEYDYKIAVAGEIWLDITNLDATKGNAVGLIQQKLAITPQETLVFGDYLNDLEMIKDAHYSYAMKNAHPQIIEAANYVTSMDNNHFGVIQTIKQFFEL